MQVITLKVTNLGKHNAQVFETLLTAVPGIRRVDTWAGRAEIHADPGMDTATLISVLREKGFSAALDDSPQTMCFGIQGMHCQSCEITIEQRLKKIDGIRAVQVNAAKGVAMVTYAGQAPSVALVSDAIRSDGYTVSGILTKHEARIASNQSLDERRPTFWELVGLFGVVLILFVLASRLGLLTSNFAIGVSVSFVAAFLVGLIAASSSCIAVTGGLLLSSSAKFNERYGASKGWVRIQPVILFVAGRIFSYGLLGGAIGVMGKAFSPSPLLTGIITVLVAVFMLVMGLDMLHVAPAWMKHFLPRMPKAISRRVLDVEDRAHPVMPFVLGAGTFLLPCGFTQALQLYALTTGSFFGGASVLLAFALGTTPALIALGIASTSLKGKWGKIFFRFSGALVVVLGFYNIQNGLTVAGYPLSFPQFRSNSTQVVLNDGTDPNVQFDGDTQVIRMKLGINPFYSPSDRYIVRAGIPVRMEIEGIGTGCRTIFQVPKFGVRVALNKAVNIVEFTPTKTGPATFSCSMGMFRGELDVVAGT